MSKAEARRERIGTGLGEVILGTLLSVVGMGVTTAQSLPKCEPHEVSPSGFDFGYGPCSDDGPSETGQAVGIGVAASGGLLIADGFRRLLTSER
jgi:hypothetical protein